MVRKVMVEGAFYSPNASEGKWAWNIARILDRMASEGKVQLDMFIPPGAENHYYYKQTECWHVFPNARFVKPPVTEEYDALIILQPGGEHNQLYINKDIKAKKRVLGWFEIYWYGRTVDRYTNIPDNADLVYALQPYGTGIHANWPKRANRMYQLPYAPFYKPEACNFDNKGIMLTIKNPCDKDFCDATVEARLDCFRLALKHAKEGLRVTVSCADKMFTPQNNPKFVPELQRLVDELRAEPMVQFYGNIPPAEMHELIREHSVIFTGKVGESGIYASFVDALNEGSYPLTWTDWPEKFFNDDSIFEPYSYDRFVERTARLLSDSDYYRSELTRQRSAMILHTEEQCIDLLERMLDL